MYFTLQMFKVQKLFFRFSKTLDCDSVISSQLKVFNHLCL